MSTQGGVFQHAQGRGVSDPVYAGIQPPPLPRGQNDRCLWKHTLLQLVTLRMVTRRYSVEYQLPACRQSVLHSEQFLNMPRDWAGALYSDPPPLENRMTDRHTRLKTLPSSNAVAGDSD